MQGAVGWMNGEIVPAAEMRLPVADLGVVGGLAVAEMLRTFRQQPFRLADHLQRLRQSADLAGLSLPTSDAALDSAVQDVVERNTALIPREDDLGVIVFVTAGLNPTYVGRDAAQQAGPTCGVHTFALQYGQWRDRYEQGARLVTLPGRAWTAAFLDPRIKARSRMPWHLADRAARERDPHAVALLADDAGRVTETAAANVCAWLGGELVSPPAGSVLEGVSLAMTCDLARQLGWPVNRRAITIDELRSADEVLLTSTPPCLLPVTAVDGQPIGDGRPGPRFQEMLSAWSATVGVDLRTQSQRQPIR